MARKLSILWYGISGVGKTTQIGEAAKWVYDKTGKKTRLVSTSGGGWQSIQAHVDAGLIDPIHIVGMDHPFETLDRYSRGWWHDENGKLQIPARQDDWDDFGAIAFDGIAEAGEWLMRYSVQQEAEGKIKISGQKVATMFRDGQSAFGAPSMSMYGTIQNYLSQYISQSCALDGKYIFWTSLEKKVTDDNTRLPAYGPEIIGNAKTTMAPAWFDNVLHLYFAGGSLKKGSDAKRVLYLRQHFEDGIPFLAKNTASFYAPLPEFLEGDDLSVGVFLELLEESRERVKEQLLGGK